MVRTFLTIVAAFGIMGTFGCTKEEPAPADPPADPPAEAPAEDPAKPADDAK